MSKRVTLTDKDMALILEALYHLHRHSVLNPRAYPEYALASKQRIEQIEQLFKKEEAKS